MSFYIDEEEKEHLLSDKKPEIEIVVDPPSRDHSDNEERDNKIWLPPATPNRGCPTPKSLWYLLFLGVLFIIKYSVRCFILNMNLVMLHFYMVHEKCQNFSYWFFFGLYLLKISLLLFVHTCSSALCSYLLLSVALHLNQLLCLQKKKKFCSQLTWKKIDKKFLLLNGSVLKDYYAFRGLKIDYDPFFI